MTTRTKPGHIRDAVDAVLAEASPDDLPLADITAKTSARLGHDVSASSVRSSLNLRINDGAVCRTTRGRYELGQNASSIDWVERPLLDTHHKEESSQFRFGTASLFLSDALEWLDSRPANTIHGVVTDPPYGLTEYTPVEQMKLRSGKGGVWRLPPSFDGHQRSPLPRFTTLSPAELESLDLFFRSLGERLHKVLTPGGHVMMAANPLVSHRVSWALQQAGLERRGEIVRLVQTMRGGDRPKNAHEEFSDVSMMPRSQWEPWLLFRKPLDGTAATTLRRWGTGGLRRISEDRPFGDVIRSAPTNVKEKRLANHPSLKPQNFLRQVVRGVLPLGEGVVLDPFAGSGSTLAAANAVGYASIGIETDPAYFDLAKEAIPRLSALVADRDHISR